MDDAVRRGLDKIADIFETCKRQEEDLTAMNRHIEHLEDENAKLRVLLSQHRCMCDDCLSNSVLRPGRDQ